MRAVTCDQLSAFETFYGRAWPTVLRDIRRRVGRHVGLVGPAPEDIAQETWMRIWQRWPQLAFATDDAAFRYALTVARNCIADHLRRYRMMRRRGQIAMTDECWSWAIDTVPDMRPDMQPEARMLRIDAHDGLAATVERILARDGQFVRQPEFARELLRATLADEPYHVTATRLGVTRSAVTAANRRLRQAIRQQLESEAV